jgi:hypothetical protein
MGRFDALTQIEEDQEKKVPLPESSSPIIDPSQVQINKKDSENQKKPANPQTRKPANPPLTLDFEEKPEKYSTRLEPSLVKKIRLHAIEKDVKDYEVIKTALIQSIVRPKIRRR